MIRSALIALGLTASGLGAGAAQAQGLVATAPILETCGGTRIVLEPQGDADVDAIARASDVVSARMGSMFSQVFDYTFVEDAQIVVSLPAALGQDLAPLEPLLERVGFAFHAVVEMGYTPDLSTTNATQIILLDAEDPTISYVLAAAPILDGSALDDVEPGFDQNNSPALFFRFGDAGAAVFADFTRNNIGESIAIVLRDQVMSAPRIMSPIEGGEGMITSSFTVDDVNELAVVLQGGVLPFSLDIVAVETMDGSDPSADFCP